MIIFGLLAWVGFFASLAVHFSTFSPGGASADQPSFFALHILMFLVFIPAVLVSNRLGFDMNKDGFTGWAGTLITVAFVYAMLNFGLFIYDGWGHKVERRGQGYVWRENNQEKRPATEAEYEYWQRRVVRGFSGHWMMFYLYPALFFTLIYGPLVRQRREECRL